MFYVCRALLHSMKLYLANVITFIKLTFLKDEVHTNATNDFTLMPMGTKMHHPGEF